MKNCCKNILIKTICFTLFIISSIFILNFFTKGNVLLFKSEASSQLDVIDVNKISLTSYPENFTDAGNFFYFTAVTPTNGRELWRSDGTEVGTYMVKDIYNGTNSSSINNLIMLNDIIYFRANDGTYGEELWRSDGTEAGTYLVKNINPGSSSSTPSYSVVMNNTLYFSANDGINGNELWRSDGTEAGTYLVKNIYPGSGNGTSSYILAMNNTLYFSANDGVNGNELWRSDGTEAGTSMVKDIRVGIDSSSISSLRSMENIIYFIANDGTYGEELWRSDGTEGGTYLVKDIYLGSTASDIRNLTVGDNLLYFSALESSLYGNELWRSDGTEAGTYMVKDVYPGSTSGIPSYETQRFIYNNSVLYFKGYDAEHGGEIWRSDGTEAGTYILKDIYPGGSSGNFYFPISVNETIYFTANDGVHGTELWRSDGTEAETHMVKDINLGKRGSSSDIFIAVNGILYFRSAEVMDGQELWRSDGTESGTYLVKNINTYTAYGSPSFFFKDQNFVYYIANTNNDPAYEDLWRSDGTEEGTIRLSQVFTEGLFFNEPTTSAVLNGILYYPWQDNRFRPELWRTDGTVEGTFAFKNISPNVGTYPRSLTEMNDILYFRARDNTYGYELWRTDGTDAGTYILKDIYSGTSSGYPNIYKVFNNNIIFNANNGVNGSELWKSNGTEEGTVMIKDINPGIGSSSVSNVVLFNDLVYFSADDGLNGKELWRSDGTEAGTVMVKDISDRVGGSEPAYLTVVGNTLYFIAIDEINGKELWKSDGSADGTLLVKDIRAGVEGIDPNYLTASGNVLFFRADDGVHGAELWRSDGSEGGTFLVKDINPGGSSAMGYLVDNEGKIYFSANDGVHGGELWESDGTEIGTKMLFDIKPGAESGNPARLTSIDNKIFFSGYHATYGNELFVLTLDRSAPTINFSSPSQYITNIATPLFEGTATDDMSNITLLQFKIGESDWISCEAKDGSFNANSEDFFCIPSSAIPEGNYTVVFRASDDEGNITPLGEESIVNLIVDTTNPSLAVNINNGTIYTISRNINILLSASDNLAGVSEMQVCENSEFNGCEWEAYSGSKSFTLSAGDGVKTIYAKVKDGAGNISDVKSAQIILDTVNNNPVITKLGLIKNIPDKDYLYYYYTANRVRIYGTAENNSLIQFERTNGIKYATQANAEGKFFILIDLPNGETKLTYSSTDLAGNVSGTRTIVLNIGDRGNEPIIPPEEEPIEEEEDPEDKEEPKEEDIPIKPRPIEETPQEETPQEETPKRTNIIEKVTKVLGSIEIQPKQVETSSEIVTVVSVPLTAVLVGAEIVQAPTMLIQGVIRLLSLFGIAKRGKKIGLIYDSKSKEPISYAVIRLFKEGKLVNTTVSDSMGYYYFELEKGKYTITVQKAGYKFPSNMIGSIDYPFEKIYKGEEIEVKEKDLLNLSIPLDPTESKLNLSNLRKRIAYKIGGLLTTGWVLVLLFGILSSTYLVATKLSLGSVLSLIWYLIIAVIYYFNRTDQRWKYGKVSREGVALSDISILAKDKQFNTVKGYRKTDENGLYNFVLPKDEYYLEIKGRDDQSLGGEGFLVKAKRNPDVIAKNIAI